MKTICLVLTGIVSLIAATSIYPTFAAGDYHAKDKAAIEKQEGH